MYLCKDKGTLFGYSGELCREDKEKGGGGKDEIKPKTEGCGSIRIMEGNVRGIE